MRLARPGSLLGPQANFLRESEAMIRAIENKMIPVGTKVEPPPSPESSTASTTAESPPPSARSYKPKEGFTPYFREIPVSEVPNSARGVRRQPQPGAPQRQLSRNVVVNPHVQHQEVGRRPGPVVIRIGPTRSVDQRNNSAVNRFHIGPVGVQDRSYYGFPQQGLRDTPRMSH